MAAVGRSRQLAKLFQSRYLQSRNLSSSRVLLAEWNYNWKPGNYPKTEEEKKAAAAKYGLLPQDYKPIPDDGSGHGDYPELPTLGEEQKDPRYDWDDHGLRRNFNEPIHMDYDALVADRSDPAYKYRYSPLKMILTFLTIYFGILFSWMWTQQWCKVFPMMDKSYPYTDFKTKKAQLFSYDEPVQRVRHYTFEPAE